MLFFVMILVWVGPAVAQAQESVLDRVIRRGVVRVGSTGDYPPFTLLDVSSQRWQGLDIDLAGNLAKSLGVRVEFVKTTWSTLLEDLCSDRFDIAMGGVSVTLARQRVGMFSIPYMDDGKILVVRRNDATQYYSLSAVDRPGVKIVVNPGGTNEEFVREHVRHARIVVWPENRTIFTQLIDGGADAMITDRSEALYQCRLHPALTVIGPLLSRTEKACLLPRDAIWKAYVDQWMRMTMRDFPTYFQSP